MILYSCEEDIKQILPKNSNHNHFLSDFCRHSTYPNFHPLLQLQCLNIVLDTKLDYNIFWNSINGNTGFSFLKDNKKRDTAPLQFCEKIYVFFRESFILTTVYSSGRNG